ncbi:MAG: SPOR domain-containing protein [Muribaculaceae bacterium]|nr:SPOR domain-containing protein [Muribaculaceae bacterium]
MINFGSINKERKTFFRVFLILVIFSFIFNHPIFAQEPVNPIEKIENESDGRINIEIPESILELLLQPSSNKSSHSNLKPGVNKLAGYRIQVFGEGRNPNTLESRAKARGNAILAKFPKYKGQIYTFSNAPNWYTRIGNFMTVAEANSALTELKQAFPSFSNEMRVVKSQIVIIKQ